MYLLILGTPLLSSLLTCGIGRKIGGFGSGVFTSACLLISFSWSVLIFYETTLNFSTTYIKLWRWLDSDLVTADFGLQFDALTATMLLVVTSVSTLVHIFFKQPTWRVTPMCLDFMSYLSLFTFFMILLVTSDNYPQLFYWLGGCWIMLLFVNKFLVD